eukprot:CAMPEP_0181323010 /NCGR_PEP_ID=MMETSP1101-20121128/19543_1 /TAXON_ID=46948 /ORGANISM="Rhodomonas abbreviata, Strain Caron Lab Isolate" /LENGTH=107 /DNA_ID=CAMNT_0023430981 /DNA_START=22 /DNA_END=345 /DNA_ORIENTATION=-
MVEFDNIPGYMSMSIPDWVVYVVMTIILAMVAYLCLQAYKVFQANAKKTGGERKEERAKKDGLGQKEVAARQTARSKPGQTSRSNGQAMHVMVKRPCFDPHSTPTGA